MYVSTAGFAVSADNVNGISVSSAAVARGDTFMVTVSAPASENADTAFIKVEFDASVFEVVTWEPAMPGAVTNSGDGFFVLTAASASRDINLSGGYSESARIAVKPGAADGDHIFRLTEHTFSYMESDGISYRELWHPAVTEVTVRVGERAPDVTSQSETSTPPASSSERTEPTVPTERSSSLQSSDTADTLRTPDGANGSEAGPAQTYSVTNAPDTVYSYMDTQAPAFTPYDGDTTQRPAQTVYINDPDNVYYPEEYVYADEPEEAEEPVDPPDEDEYGGPDEPAEYDESGYEAGDRVDPDEPEYELDDEGELYEGTPETTAKTTAGTTAKTAREKQKQTGGNEKDPPVTRRTQETKAPEQTKIPAVIEQTTAYSAKKEVSINLHSELRGLTEGKANISTRRSFYDGDVAVTLSNSAESEQYAAAALNSLGLSGSTYYAFDISVSDVNTGSAIHKLARGYMDFTVPIPANFTPGRYEIRVYRVDNGIPERLETAVGGTSIAFRAAEFSPYVIVGIPQDPPADGAADEIITKKDSERAVTAYDDGSRNPHTGTAAAITVPAVLMLCFVLLLKRKKSRKRGNRKH